MFFHWTNHREEIKTIVQSSISSFPHRIWNVTDINSALETASNFCAADFFFWLFLFYFFFRVLLKRREFQRVNDNFTHAWLTNKFGYSFYVELYLMIPFYYILNCILQENYKILLYILIYFYTQYKSCRKKITKKREKMKEFKNKRERERERIQMIVK